MVSLKQCAKIGLYSLFFGLSTFSCNSSSNKTTNHESQKPKNVAGHISLNIGCANGDVFDLYYAYLWESERGVYYKMDRRTREELGTSANSMISDIYTIENVCRQRNSNFGYVIGGNVSEVQYNSNADTLTQKLKNLRVLDN